jgi:hypothetical protein
MISQSARAVWRFMEFKTYDEFPNVTRLTIHEPGKHAVYFDEDASWEEIEDEMKNARLTLMVFFKYNAEHPDETPYLYSQFPVHFVFGKSKRE